MLQANMRHALYYDLAMAPYPSDAQPIPLESIVPGLKSRWERGECVQVIDSDRRVVRISDIQDLQTKGGGAVIGLLFCLGDRDKAIPGFTDFDTGDVRLPELKRNEVGGLSVHAVVSLAPTKDGGHIYRMVYEDVNGFGRSVIQSFLRNQFKLICEDEGFEHQREGRKDPIKSRPLVELAGHPSDRLKNSLQKGRLTSIELIQYVDDIDFDEAQHLNSPLTKSELGSVGSGRWLTGLIHCRRGLWEIGDGDGAAG